jgi:hypothetical protein
MSQPNPALVPISPRHRNRKSEHERGQLSLFHEMADLYDQRTHGNLTEV